MYRAHHRRGAGAGARPRGGHVTPGPGKPSFAALRDDLAAVFEAVVAEGDAGAEQAAAAAARVWERRSRLDAELGLDPGPVLAELSERLAGIFSAEVAAVGRLGEVVA